MTLSAKMRPNAKYDWKEIDNRLRNDVERLVTLLTGEQPNLNLSKADETRWGNKGGLAAVIRGPDIGRITPFDGCGRGMTPLQFIQEKLNCDFGEAVIWAAEDFLGMAGSGRAPNVLTFPKPERKSEKELSDLNAAVERDERIRWARRLYDRSVSATGTLAARYLTKRGIDCDLPDSIRFVRKAGNEDYDALLVPATNAEGEIVAVQRVFLSTLGAKASISTQKRTNGTPKDGVFRLEGEDDGPLYLAEGPENGLSVWMATGAETWVTLGSVSGVERHLPTDRPIIIARDGDAPGSPADKALESAIKSMALKGIAVSVTTPALGEDANDILRYKDAEALRQHLSAAVQRFPLEPCYPPRTMTLEDAEKAVSKGLDQFCNDVPRYWNEKAAYDDRQAGLVKAA